MSKEHINNITVIDPQVISKITNKNTMKLSDLTPEQKKLLMEEAKQEEAAAALKITEDRKAYKQMVGEAVPKLFDTLLTQSAALSRTKLEMFQSVKDIIELKKEAYGVKDNQQSHSLSNDDASQTIKIGYRVNDGWDDTLNAGIEKVNQFITGLATNDETQKLVKTINRLLQKDGNGNLKSSRVLELEKIAEDYNSALLNDGIEIIRKSWSPVKSCYFIEAYYNDTTGKKRSVPLSISSVEFPNNETMDFV